MHLNHYRVTVKFVLLSCFLCTLSLCFSYLPANIRFFVRRSRSQVLTMEKFIRDEIEEGYEHEDDLEPCYDAQGTREEEQDTYAAIQQYAPNSFAYRCGQYDFVNYNNYSNMQYQHHQQQGQFSRETTESLPNEDFPILPLSSVSSNFVTDSGWGASQQRSTSSWGSSSSSASFSSPWLHTAQMQQQNAPSHTFINIEAHRGSSSGRAGGGRSSRFGGRDNTFNSSKGVNNNFSHRGGRGGRGGREGSRQHSQKFHHIPSSCQPLVITIGPVCAGKTTYLKNYGKLIDIAIDDAPDSYKKMNIDDILLYTDSIGTNTKQERIFKQKYYQRLKLNTVFERYSMILQSEQVQLLFLFADKITIEEFVETMQSTFAENFGGSSELYELFISTVLEMKFEMSSRDFSDIFETASIDIFCKDMLFPECINWARRKFEETVCKYPDRPVAWGNTNLKTRDYLNALELAEKSGRPIHFVRSGFELDPVTLHDLIQRNLKRFFKTGRYIPSIVLERTLETSRIMLQEQFSTPESLCKAEGFVLNEKNGTVRRNHYRDRSQPLQKEERDRL